MYVSDDNTGFRSIEDDLVERLATKIGAALKAQDHSFRQPQTSRLDHNNDDTAHLPPTGDSGILTLAVIEVVIQDALFPLLDRLTRLEDRLAAIQEVSKVPAAATQSSEDPIQSPRSALLLTCNSTPKESTSVSSTSGPKDNDAGATVDSHLASKQHAASDSDKNSSELIVDVDVTTKPVIKFRESSTTPAHK
jgi:hypothetical protein